MAQADPELEHTTDSAIELILRKSMQAIAAEIARNPSCLNQVEWRDLERVLREVFEALGFSTRLTRPAKDGGYDLELSCTEHGEKVIFLVELKHWTQGAKRPGKAIMASFFDIVVRHEVKTTGLLLSSSGFTREVLRGRTEIERQRVRLGDADKIVLLCQNYLENREGVWFPTACLPHILFYGTY